MKIFAKVAILGLLAAGAIAPAASSISAASDGASASDGRTWAAPKHLSRKAPKHL